MAPPTATTTETEANGDYRLSTMAPLEPGISETKAKLQMSKFPGPPKFADKYEEREYLKGRLAAAFRIFGKYGFDEGWLDTSPCATQLILQPSGSTHLAWHSPLSERVI